jgi:hypothetical protein
MKLSIAVGTLMLVSFNQMKAQIRPSFICISSPDNPCPPPPAKPTPTYTPAVKWYQTQSNVTTLQNQVNTALAKLAPFINKAPSAVTVQDMKNAFGAYTAFVVVMHPTSHFTIVHHNTDILNTAPLQPKTIYPKPCTTCSVSSTGVTFRNYTSSHGIARQLDELVAPTWGTTYDSVLTDPGLPWIDDYGDQSLAHWDAGDGWYSTWMNLNNDVQSIDAGPATPIETIQTVLYNYLPPCSNLNVYSSVLMDNAGLDAGLAGFAYFAYGINMGGPAGIYASMGGAVVSAAAAYTVKGVAAAAGCNGQE